MPSDLTTEINRPYNGLIISLFFAMFKKNIFHCNIIWLKIRWKKNSWRCNVKGKVE